ncbi:MAG: hypothetical protein IK104_06845 [Clostridia bacterium]|nr:hypothetical protein [Clostridia bacterium]MBR5410372.1 hypothetical protein [Clostridia bacterium]
MKKNILRVLSLVIVAAMLFAFASCTQKVEIRLVDKDGNDMTFPAAAANNTPANNTPSNNDTPAPSSETPAPSSETPSSEQPASDTPASDTPASDTPASDTPAPSSETPSSETPASTVPSTKEEICNLYAKAVNDIKNNGSASYNKIEFQTITTFNITGIGAVDNLIKGIAGRYFKDEASADHQVAQKGQDSSKDKMLGWTLTDYSKVTSASLTQNGGNYDIVIKMADEDTPHKGGGSHLAAVGSVLLWEDIEKELVGIGELKEWQGNIHVVYTNYTITATLTPEGKLVNMTHHTDVDIQIAHAKISFVKLENKNVAMENTARFTDFVY